MQRPPKTLCLWVLAGLVLLLAAVPTLAQQTTGVPGSPSATTTIDGEQLPPPPQKFGGVIKETAAQSKPYWPTRVVPPKGAPNVLLIMTDDAGYGVPSTFGGVIPTPALDRIAQARAALHQLPFDGAVLADARRADHRTQSSLGRLRRGRRAGHRLSRLRQHHHQGQGHDRPHPEGQRLSHLVVRQEPQHARVPGEPGRPVRPVADRHGLRVLLRLHGRRHQPVGAEPLPQHDADLSLPGQARLEPDHRDGRRGDRLHEPHERADARPAVLRLLRARRHACAAPSDQGVGRQDQRHAPVRRGLEQAARDRSSKTRRSSA